MEAAPARIGLAAESSRATAGAELVVKRVFKTYDRDIRALADASLHLLEGEFAALTGQSGAGKTTLLNLVGGLDRPDSGAIAVDGVSVPDHPDPVRYRREVVGFVFQRHHLLPTLNAQANVEVPMIAAGVPHEQRIERAHELLRRVGLAHRAGHLPSELSGGERQRIAVARALANRPRLLLADEPTGSLDSLSGARVLELLAALKVWYGMTLLMVSYDPAVARIADRVLRMVDGRIVEGGRPER